jgi:dienelactone hydrolase
VRRRRPTGDAAFAAPEFPRAPAFTSLGCAHEVLVERAEITYWKRDGQEIGPWLVDFRRPDPECAEGAAAAGKLKRALIVVLPIAGKETEGALFARAYAQAGFAALELHPIPREADSGVLHTLKGTTKALTEDTANLRRVLAWARTLPEVDPARIGVIGVSRGAIVSALAAELDPNLSAVLILGGADLAGLFRDSGLNIVERLRREETARAGGDLDRAVAKAAAILANVDPATRSGKINPARTLLVNARWDHVIPKAQALALRQAAGGAEQHWFYCGHYSTMIFAPKIRRLSLAHFERTLQPKHE